ARTHGPFLSDGVARRLGISPERAIGALRALETDGRVVRGEFRPDGHEREWCDAEVLRQLRRRSLASLRREVEPVEQSVLARFLPEWHGIRADDSARGGGTRLDRLVEAVGMLQGAAIPATVLETEVFPARIPGYRAGDLDELCAAGEVVWVGAGAIGAGDGRLRLYFRDQLALLAPAVEPIDPPAGVVHDAIRAVLQSQGAVFWSQLRTATAPATEAELLSALWDLVWSGEVTNDSMAPLRAFLAGTARRAPSRSQAPGLRFRGRPRPGRLSSIGPASGAGRWSLVAPLLVPGASPTEVAHAAALQLVERHGVVTREAVLAEGVSGGFAGVYGVLKVLEERGQVRRGYFVDGLGAAQFAIPGAVDRLRALREPQHDAVPLVLAATDPAQPFGAALSWPENPGRPARSAGALVVLASGLPLAWYDRRGHHLVRFPAGHVDDRWAEAMAMFVKDGRLRSLEVRKVDGQAIGEANPDALASLKRVGFLDGYRGLVLRG
ncbi:MAG: DEAD/DEAH box helicase, partial [Acidobacteria bacterium]|nr:DEAD/DEAH box helicase [Acidobacteriota bacterium]